MEARGRRWNTNKCGGQTYNPTFYLCCNGNIQRKHGSLSACWLGRSRTLENTTCAAEVENKSSQDRGQPVVGRSRTIEHTTYAAVVIYCTNQDCGQPVVVRSRTIENTTCAAEVENKSSQDRGQPVVGRSRTIQHSICAAMANSNVRVVGILPVEIPAWC